MKSGTYKKNLTRDLEYKSFYPTSLKDLEFESFDKRTPAPISKVSLSFKTIFGIGLPPSAMS